MRFQLPATRDTGRGASAPCLFDGGWGAPGIRCSCWRRSTPDTVSRLTPTALASSAMLPYLPSASHRGRTPARCSRGTRSAGPTSRSSHRVRTRTAN